VICKTQQPDRYGPTVLPMDERQMGFLTGHFSSYNYEQIRNGSEASWTLARGALY